MQAAAAEAGKILEPAEKLLKDAGVSYTTEAVCGPAGTVIAERADKGGYAGVVMGTRGMGAVKTLVLGSVANQVVHLAHVPVTLVR
jgi:nucleotide-binding universal stress UspA family protein